MLSFIYGIAECFRFYTNKRKKFKSTKNSCKIRPYSQSIFFNSNSLIKFRLPANVQNAYMDWSDEWSLQFKLELINVMNISSIVTETTLN